MKEVLRIAAVIIAILLLRIGLVNIYEMFGVQGGLGLFEALGIIILDPLNLPLTLSTTVALGYLAYRIKWLGRNLPVKLLSWAVIVAIGTAISSSLAMTKSGCESGSAAWYSILFSSIIFVTIILVVLQLWLWFRSSRRYMSKVMAKSERTQYQYSQLKRQLNPHFLFNSLSILDYLVQEGLTARASDYIKKLANIYRYLLKQEEYDTIELSKEVYFLNLYIDIMRERFLDSFEVKIEIPTELLSRKVVPCSLQVLVENAFKHNTVSPSHKLLIAIFAEGDKIVVTNNLNRKKIPSESNGFGLKNLRTQYNELSGTRVEVIETKDSFTVKFPLI